MEDKGKTDGCFELSPSMHLSTRLYSRSLLHYVRFMLHCQRDEQLFSTLVKNGTLLIIKPCYLTKA